MTDNEIIKALECCVECDTYCEECDEDCPLKESNNCTYVLRRESLDLINRQKAEIEALHLSVQSLSGFLSSAKAQNKSEAYKEFAERLKAEADRYDDEEFYVNDRDIDNILKELTEQ